MNGWTLCFVLLLPLTGCDDSEVTHVKTIGSEPDVTPLCTNGTMNIITLIICSISTERSRGEECRLTYQYGRDFEHGCDSRFTLIIENHTVFLHLTNLTAEDSGNYTCECSLPDGTFIHHLNITVKVSERRKREESSSRSADMTILWVLIGVMLILIVSGVILGFIHRRLSHGRRLHTTYGQPNREPQDIEPYSTFIRTENGLYSTVRMQESSSSNLFPTR